MGFERRLEHRFEVAAVQFFAPGGFRRLPGIAYARTSPLLNAKRTSAVPL